MNQNLQITYKVPQEIELLTKNYKVLQEKKDNDQVADVFLYLLISWW